MSSLLIMKIPSLYCNLQFVMKQLGLGRADNGVQHFTDIPPLMPHVAVGNASVDSIRPNA